MEVIDNKHKDADDGPWLWKCSRNGGCWQPTFI